MEADIVVIGSGPAGALAAGTCAQSGARVLLVDRAAFPRDKVCGCCINRAASAQLDASGHARLIDRLEARHVNRLELASGRARAVLPVGPMRVVSRAAFDHALVRAAIERGVTFMPATTATVGAEDRAGVAVRLTARPHGAAESCRARCVLVADGLAGSALRDRPGFATSVRRGSRFGAAALLDPAEHPEAAAIARDGTIVMLCGRTGYAGIVGLEDGRVNIAAALDLERARAAGGPGRAVRRLLQVSGYDVATLERAAWRGTPSLTRTRARIESERVLVIGDAAGYVEPFTGEGLAWALASAAAAAPIALERCIAGPVRSGSWAVVHRTNVASRRRACRSLAWLLRHPKLAHAAIRTLAWRPGLAAPLAARLGAPRHDREGRAAASAGKAVSA